MTTKSTSLLALVTALSLGCNTTSSQNAAAAPPPAHSPEGSSGSERGLPDLSTYAHRLDEPSRDEWQRPEEVVALLGCRPGMTAVDLGAGTGYFLRYLSAAVGARGRVLALELSPSTIDFLSVRIETDGLPNVQPILVAPDDPALAAHSVDRILIANTWHHISGRPDYAAKLLAALRPGGVVMIVDFRMDSPEGPPLDHRLTSDTVVGELESAGFEVRVLEASLPYHYVVTGQAP
jgi:predicted methyltransferase